jgi:hypothetical protein
MRGSFGHSCLRSDARQRREPAPVGEPSSFPYAALKGMTLLSFATCRLVAVCGARGLRSKVRRRLLAGSRLGTLDDHPERPVQIAMKVTASSAAGSSHAGGQGPHRSGRGALKLPYKRCSHALSEPLSPEVKTGDLSRGFVFRRKQRPIVYWVHVVLGSCWALAMVFLAAGLLKLTITNT